MGNYREKVLELAANAPHIKPLAVSSVFEVSGESPGPRVLVMAGVHGNEQNPVSALLKFFAQLAKKEISVKRGTLVIALANEAALEKNVRYVEHNLNRLFLDDKPGLATYEHNRASELKPVLRGVDLMLDLHSTSTSSPPFIMCEKHLLPIARNLGISHIVTGWGELGEQSVSGDTESYVNKHGGKGFTLENGQHNWPGGIASALNGIYSFLNHVLGTAIALQQFRNPVFEYHLFFVHTRRGQDFCYTRKLQSFDKLKKGAVFAIEDGLEIAAPEDCFVIMPAPAEIVKPGEDQFLLAHGSDL